MCSLLVLRFLVDTSQWDFHGLCVLDSFIAYNKSLFLFDEPESLHLSFHSHTHTALPALIYLPAHFPPLCYLEMTDLFMPPTTCKYNTNNYVWKTNSCTNSKSSSCQTLTSPVGVPSSFWKREASCYHVPAPKWRLSVSSIGKICNYSSVWFPDCSGG